MSDLSLSQPPPPPTEPPDDDRRELLITLAQMQATLANLSRVLLRDGSRR